MRNIGRRQNLIDTIKKEGGGARGNFQYSLLIISFKQIKKKREKKKRKKKQETKEKAFIGSLSRTSTKFFSARKKGRKQGRKEEKRKKERSRRVDSVLVDRRELLPHPGGSKEESLSSGNRKNNVGVDKANFNLARAFVSRSLASKNRAKTFLPPAPPPALRDKSVALVI